jgi:hypothetical protein
MLVLSWISFYAPVVIIILAVVAVVFSFFWVFLPLPRWLSNAMGRLLVRFWRGRERRRRRRFNRVDAGTLALSVLLASSRALSLHEMDINKMLAELRADREQVEEAIMVLERLARGQGKRRGRPPAWMTTIKRRGRPPGSKNKPKSGGTDS